MSRQSGADTDYLRSGRLAGRTVAVAHHDGFVAGYIARALVAAGAKVVGSHGCLTDARAWLLTPNLSVTSACVGSLLYDAADAGLIAAWQTRFSALLFIGTGEPPLLSIRATVLSYPFASYQIIDAMSVMFEAKEEPDEGEQYNADINLINLGLLDNTPAKDAK